MYQLFVPSLEAQSVASPTANPGAVSSILARPHTFWEMYHEIFLISSAGSRMALFSN